MMNTEIEIHYAPLTLAGTAYAVISERLLLELARRAGASIRPDGAGGGSPSTELPLEAERLAGRLIERRRAAGLSQAELARRASACRVETLNRIERRP